MHRNWVKIKLTIKIAVLYRCEYRIIFQFFVVMVHRVLQCVTVCYCKYI